MRSIERQLVAWIMGALLLGSILVAMTTYMVTLDEMNEVFDADLKNVAHGVARYHWTNTGTVDVHEPVLIGRNDRPDDSEIATFAWDSSRRLVYASDSRVPIRYVAEEGLSHPRLGGEDWIVYTASHDGGIVQAAQRRSSRREMAGESAAKILPPLLVLSVVVGGLLILGLRRGLAPLDAAARDIATRSARSLEPIESADVPMELLPMVRSINGLMLRLDHNFAGQRQFLADAAHELRSPVTALVLQLRLLEGSSNEVERAAALMALHQGIARSQRLIEQLLAVARSEPDVLVAPLMPLDLRKVVGTVVESLSIKADAWGIDLGAELPSPAPVMGDEEQLTVLLNNLVENALRHAPGNTQVDVGVAVRDGQSMLYVRDRGPGIPPSQRLRVFDRFYRGSTAPMPGRSNVGSGLGLAIVKAVAERHGATVQLVDGPEKAGLEVRVLFPYVNAS